MFADLGGKEAVLGELTDPEDVQRFEAGAEMTTRTEQYRRIPGRQRFTLHDDSSKIMCSYLPFCLKPLLFWIADVMQLNGAMNITRSFVCSP